MTQTQNDPRFDLAETALINLYQSWEIHGGPSPDTHDEAAEIAHVLGVDPVTDDEALETIWIVACMGAEPRMIAIAHVAAIDAKGA